MGFAFERFCVKNAYYLAKIMGFEEQVLYAAPHFIRNAEHKSFQIDLMYKRSDSVITICEIKYNNKKISTKVIPEIEKNAVYINFQGDIHSKKH